MDFIAAVSGPKTRDEFVNRCRHQIEPRLRERGIVIEPTAIDVIVYESPPIVPASPGGLAITGRFELLSHLKESWIDELREDPERGIGLVREAVQIVGWSVPSAVLLRRRFFRVRTDAPRDPADPGVPISPGSYSGDRSDDRGSGNSPASGASQVCDMPYNGHGLAGQATKSCGTHTFTDDHAITNCVICGLPLA